MLCDWLGALLPRGLRSHNSVAIPRAAASPDVPYTVSLASQNAKGLSKMGLEGEPRVAAAKRWLQSRLEEAFCKTSFDCRSVFAEFQYPPEATGEGDPVVRRAIREFRDGSLECVRELARRQVAKNLNYA